MELGAPIALLALLVVPAILALYLLRPRRRRVQVPALALWQEALASRERGLGLRRLLRNLALLLLLAAAAAGALALAAPRWLSPVSERGDAVMVLDVSASMQSQVAGGSRFERARERALGFVESMPDGARVLLIAAGRTPRLRGGFDTDRERVRAQIEAEQPTDEAGDPRRALGLALSLLRSRDAGEVHFFTDAGFDAGVHPGSSSIVYHVVGEATPAPRNVAITRFDFRAEPGRERGVAVLVELTSYLDEAVEVPLTVELDGGVLFEERVRLPEGGTRTLVRSFDVRPYGVASARIDVDDDLDVDDRAYAALNVEDGLRVAVVGPLGVYLDSVLRAVPRLRHTRHDADTDLAALARGNDVVVLNGVTAATLPPGRFLLLDTLPASVPLEDAGRMDLARIDVVGDSALMRGVDLSPVQVSDARAVRVRGGGSTGVQPLFGTGDRHLAAAVLDAERRVIYLGFDLARTDLPLTPAFPLLMARLLDWLRPPENPVSSTQIATGEPYLLRAPGAAAELILRRPSGDASSLVLPEGELRFDDTERAGIYRYTVGGVRRYFAANLTDAEESDLGRRAALPSAAPTAADRRTARASRLLWPWLCTAALLLLMLEWLLRCAGRERV